MQVLDRQADFFQKRKTNISEEIKFPTEIILNGKSKTSIYKKESFIFEPGQISDHIYMVDKGRVKISNTSNGDKEILKSLLGEGEIFGEMALAGEKVRKDFAVAMDDDTAVRFISKHEIMKMMSANPDINEAVFQVLGKRIRRTERRLFSIILKDARTRIVDFLKDLAEEKGKKVGFETMIKNHFTHKDIANLTGTSRQTVTTTLNALRDQNIINFDRRRILIRDIDLLV